MSDALDLLPWASGPGAIVLWKVGEWIVSRFVRKTVKLEEQAEQTASAASREANETLKRVERAVDRLQVTAEATSTALTVITNRVEGYSKNHGDRLTVLEEHKARHDERIKVLESRRK